MTCKDCVHYKVCLYEGYELFDYNGSALMNDFVERMCRYFKDKSRFVKLPCKVGDTVYQVDSERIYESTVKRIIYDTDGIAFDERAIGKSVFLTREQAEKALEERSVK